MLKWFERRLDAYPAGEPTEPPKGLLEFCLHYSHGAKRWLALMAVAAAGVAIGEIVVFGFIGDVVNWLADADPNTFLETDGWKLALMGAMIVFIVPGIALISTLTMHQTLLGNFPQRIRWMAHRYLIRQSMSYFQDEFAGRIGAKLMQTSLAVREVVMKLLDMLVYVVVYFIGAVLLVASADWRLTLPFLGWLVAYIAIMIYFIPRMGKISQAQADARSLMTGRIVDSYTNIATVKLFSHSNREETYAKEAMDEFLDTVHRQMRLFTVLNMLVLWSNALLLFAVGATGIWLWMGGLMSPG